MIRFIFCVWIIVANLAATPSFEWVLRTLNWLSIGCMLQGLYLKWSNLNSYHSNSIRLYLYWKICAQCFHQLHIYNWFMNMNLTHRHIYIYGYIYIYITYYYIYTHIYSHEIGFATVCLKGCSTLSIEGLRASLSEALWNWDQHCHWPHQRGACGDAWWKMCNMPLKAWSCLYVYVCTYIHICWIFIYTIYMYMCVCNGWNFFILRYLHTWYIYVFR